jgi:amino acid transporter
MELLILLFFVVLIGIPIGISYLIYQWIKKKEFEKKWRLLAIIPLIIVGYFFYTAIYPDEDYYKNDFKEVTDMEFPKSGKILYKTASYPDQFGDYTSSFLAEFENDYLQKLEANLKKKGFVKKENNMSSEELDYIENKKGSRKYSAEYSKELNGGKYYSVGFLNDNKSVVITRVSW